MNNHIQITFFDIQPEQQDWVIAHLAEAGFEGFEEKEMELTAFIPQRNYNPAILKEMAYKFQLEYAEKIIPEQNWNQLWESSFHPVIVGDFVAVRANFHAPINGIRHEIIITPKMSFGTGHHATTFMMMEQMQNIDFQNKKVFDFGTGTGVLAILADKMGAKEVLAMDNDEWSINNAKENIERNSCSHVKLVAQDFPASEYYFDILLANINKHVILEHLSTLFAQLNKPGIVLLSGLLHFDEKEMIEAVKKHALILENKTVKDNWLCLKFRY